MVRNLLWTYVFSGEVSDTLVGKEIIVAIAVAAFFILLYWGFKRMIFYGINDNISVAKYGALVLSISLALTWLIASLNLLGFWSSIIAVVLLAISLMFNLIYLLVTRNR